MCSTFLHLYSELCPQKRVTFRFLLAPSCYCWGRWLEHFASAEQENTSYLYLLVFFPYSWAGSLQVFLQTQKSLGCWTQQEWHCNGYLCVRLQEGVSRRPLQFEPQAPTCSLQPDCAPCCALLIAEQAQLSASH